MTMDKSLSFQFYKYLCQVIGSVEEVRVRRLTYTINDFVNQGFQKFTSGSKGEGLNLKGSDLDIMYIDPFFTVYESDRDFVFQFERIPLVMDTEDTPPCFTELRLLINPTLHLVPELIFEKNKISSELYKLYNMKRILCKNLKIHGPCISSKTESHDFAWSFKCNHWISQAQHWIIRSRTTWPSPELISKITACGVLFVPIGCKGSLKENLQWRISFSVAEKFLIFSFGHTQLLCYALLKILLKEIVDKHQDLKGLLCSYFLKTLMFWISEESDPSVWRPDDIVPCFMACLKRLLYCVEYETLLHYFIPDNNLFYLRFNTENKDKMTNVLKNLYEQGIHCFDQSETLKDVSTLPCEVPNSLSIEQVTLIQDIMKIQTSHKHPTKLLYTFLHHSSTSVSRGIFSVMLSNTHQLVSHDSQNQPRSNNKRQYHKRKHDLSYLLIRTQSDAVSGWLMLASYFYVNKNYLAALSITNYTFLKFTTEQIYPWQKSLNLNQKSALNLNRQEKFCKMIKTILILDLPLKYMSSIVPSELQLDVVKGITHFNPVSFAHFLSFLCYHNLQDITSCKHSLIQLSHKIRENLYNNTLDSLSAAQSVMCIGIAHHMMGETNIAGQLFRHADDLDVHNQTSARLRLSKLT